MIITRKELINSVAAEGNPDRRLKIAVAVAVVEADPAVGKEDGGEIDAAVVRRIDGLPANRDLSRNRGIEVDAGMRVDGGVVAQVAGEERGDQSVIDQVVGIGCKRRDAAIAQLDISMLADRHRCVGPIIEWKREGQADVEIKGK